MILLELFLGFLQVGCFSFGGAYGAIPLIRDVVLSYGWLDDEMITYMIAVGESTPGSIMVNLATYVGSSQAGFFGALVATTAVVLPAFIIVLLITLFMKKAWQNRYVQASIGGVKPALCGIILATGVYMILKNGFIIENSALSVRPLVLTVVLAAVYIVSKKIFKKGLSPILFICISAAAGIIAYA